MTNDSSNRPLVTFYVMTYNQARFVRPAVEAALAQTYSPLEILLSDDCSADDTFAIIRETIRGYAGPHTIVTNRNPRNLGVSGHVNRLVELASGELIIASDGDDISHPQRVERFVEAWLREGKPAALVSSVVCIDDDGKVSRTRDGREWMEQFLPEQDETRAASLVRFANEGSPRLISCAGAWTKSMYAAFGPMVESVWHEDDVITLRAWLYDRIAFIPDVLVSYREHDSNIFNRLQPPLATIASRRNAEAETKTHARRRHDSLLGYLPDLDVALERQWITPQQHDDLRRRVLARCEFYRAIEEWWHVSWWRRLADLRLLLQQGGPSDWRWGVARLLPFQVFLSMAAMWARVRPREAGPRAVERGRTKKRADQAAL